MKIKRIDWKDTLAIRQNVLWPNKTKEFCMLDGDELAKHYGIYYEEKLIGVASASEHDDTVRLRKFAVLLEYQSTAMELIC